MTAGEEETSGGTPLASRRPGRAGVEVYSCLPLDVPVPATAGLGVSVLTVVVTREEPQCPAASAGAGGGGTRPEKPGNPAPAGARVVSVDILRGNVSPGEDVGVGIVVSGAQQPGEPGDMYDHKEGAATRYKVRIPTGVGKL